VLSLSSNPRFEDSKDKTGTKTMVTMAKPPIDKKDQESTNIEELEIIINKPSTEIFDMKKSIGEGSLNPKTLFKFPPNKTTPHTTKRNPPTNSINIEKFVKAFKHWKNETPIGQRKMEKKKRGSQNKKNFPKTPSS
jgi:hypothetical protein